MERHSLMKMRSEYRLSWSLAGAALLSVGLVACQSSEPIEEGADVVATESAVAEVGSTIQDGADQDGADQNSPDSTASDGNGEDTDGSVSTDDAESGLPDAAPNSFWAITEDTYELVEVDSRTGEILGMFGAWGDPFGDCEGEEGCLFQGLNELAVSSDGHLWISDCCEPAVGNIFKVEAGNDFSTDSFIVFGSHPVPSPNGDLIAHDGLEATIVSDSSGQQLGVIGNEVDGGSDNAPPFWYQPVAWIDDETLVVRAIGDLVDNLVLFDLSDPTSPQRTGPTMGGLISHTDAAVRSDGMIFALARPPGGDDAAPSDLMGWVFDPSSGDVIAETDLPDDTWEIDYDATGTFLLTVGQDGIVRFFGAGQSGVLAEGFVSVSW